MTGTDLTALAPMIALAATAVIVMLAIAFWRDHRVTVTLTLAGLGVAYLMFPVALTVTPHQATPLLMLDNYAVFYMGLIFAMAVGVAALSYSYLETRTSRPDEFYILLLLATLGSAVLVSSNQFASFFLGLELLSISLYAMIAYLYTSDHALEAGVKYLILAAASSAFLLFGMALIYADRGTLAFEDLVSTVGGGGLSVLWLAGFGLMVVAIGFKLAVVPFHFWVPDVYQGAPVLVTAFIATASKGAIFALLLRLSTAVDIPDTRALFWMFSAIAIVSMFAGNLLALLQDNVKRMLAYSSIAHMGYLFVAFLASGDRALTAATFYLVAYFVTTLAAFGVMSILSGPERDADQLDDYQGLFWRRPWLAAVLAAAMFSLAGIPLTAGFIGKFYVLTAGAGSDLWLLSFALVISSAIGLFYYLRVIVRMYLAADSQGEPELVTPAQPLVGGLVLSVLSLALVWFGVYPAPLIDLIQEAVSHLT